MGFWTRLKGSKEMPDVKIDLIRSSPYQPRLHFELKTLKESIEKDGMLAVPIVREKPDKKTKYEMIDGERRWRTVKELGWKTIPIEIIDADDEKARRMVYTLNEERQPYTLEENTKFFRRMYDEMGSADAVANAFRKSHSTIWQYINISLIPEHLQKAVWTGKITTGYIREIEPVFTEARNEIGNLRMRRYYNESLSYQKIVAWCEAIYKKEIQTPKELREEYVDPYLARLGKARIEKTKEVIQKKAPDQLIEAKVKMETAEDYERAAKSLKKKAKELMTPEQKAREKRKKQIAQAKISLNATVKKIDKAGKVIDAGGFRKRLDKIKKTIEEKPAEAKDQLTALGKDVTGAKRQRQAELKEEAKRKQEEEAKEKAKKREDALRKRLEAETEKKIKEAEKKAEKKLMESREFIEQATKMAHLAKLRGKYPRKGTGSTLAVNALNELTGSEWLKFTTSWYVFDALESDLREERAATIDVEDHPATFSSTMISEYVRFFTKKGGVVLDPFVGIGSTLVACMRTGRKGIGIDIVEKFAGISRKRVEKDPMQRVICGDAWEIGKYDLPKIDYCITSPPYYRMLGKVDVTQKKRMQARLATDYGKKVVMPDSVDKYVDRLVDLFSKIADKMRKDGYLTVILQNFRDKEKMIPLAWKFAMAMQDSGKWIFKGERIWCQSQKSLHPFGYPADWVSNIHHHYCLIFKRRI